MEQKFRIFYVDYTNWFPTYNTFQSLHLYNNGDVMWQVCPSIRYSNKYIFYLWSTLTLTKLLLLNSKHLCNFKYIASTYIIKVCNRFSHPTIFPCVRKLTHPYQTNIDIEKFGYKVPAIQKINWIMPDENNFISKEVEKLATEYFPKYPSLNEINCIVVIPVEEARTGHCKIYTS